MPDQVGEQGGDDALGERGHVPVALSEQVGVGGAGLNRGPVGRRFGAPAWDQVAGALDSRAGQSQGMGSSDWQSGCPRPGQSAPNDRLHGQRSGVFGLAVIRNRGGFSRAP
jgi:hypothetical protein